MNASSKCLRTPAAAKYVGLTPRTLAKLRLGTKGPVFSKLSHRLVVYSIDDLDDWITSTKRSSTTDVGGLQ